MKKFSLKVLAVLVILIFGCQFTVAFATSGTSELKQEKQETQNKITDAQNELEDVQAEKSEVVSEVEDLNNKIDSYETEISDLENKIDTLNNQIAESEKKIKQAEKEYQEKSELLNERLVLMYEDGNTSYLDFLLSSESLTDFISNYYLVTELASYDTDLLEQIETKKEEIQSEKENIQNNKEEIANSKTQKESTQKQLAATKAEKNEQIKNLSKEEAQLQKELDELKAHESNISSKIKKMQEKYDKKITSTNSSNNNSTSNSKNSTNSSNNLSNSGTSSYGFGWPVSNHTIGTGYGVSGTYWSSGHHTGVDFEVALGTRVYAVGNGQVFDTGYNSAYGNFVEIYHGNNIYSFYAHASSVNVKVGQNVSKGQQIMLSGKTGNVTGAHLHFEIRTPGFSSSNCVNPLNYLP